MPFAELLGDKSTLEGQRRDKRRVLIVSGLKGFLSLNRSTLQVFFCHVLAWR